MLTNLQFSTEFIIFGIGVVFAVGGFHQLVKWLESKMKKIEEELQENKKEVFNLKINQAVNDEKITKIDQKISKLELNSSEILTILTKRDKV